MRKTPAFRLRRVVCGAIGAGVKRCFTGLIAIVFLVSSCKEKGEVIVSETRTRTTRDSSPKLLATSDERFRDAKPSPVKGETPEGWLALPGTQFRLLNYRFGESGLGEVSVSIASGSVLDNVNRWLKQFGAEAADQVVLEKLRNVPIAEASGTWVEVEGEYSPGMGAAPKPGYALAGVIAAVDGRILTLKMTGPKGEVEAARSVLEDFAKSLKLAE